MACGQDNSLSAENLTEQEANPDYESLLIEKLDYNAKKSTFTWLGSFDELQAFCFKYLNMEPADCSITANERAKTIKTGSLILNFYKTKTLQVQGSDCQNVKAHLQSILNAAKVDNLSNYEAAGDLTYNDEEPPNSCPVSERSEDSVWQTSSGDHAVSAPDVKREIGKIWSQITLIHEKISSFEKPREADLNNQQRSQKLKEENEILKEHLNVMKNKMVELTEERDSLKLVVSLLSKDLYQSRQDNNPPKISEHNKAQNINSSSSEVSENSRNNTTEPAKEPANYHKVRRRRGSKKSKKSTGDETATPSSSTENKFTTVLVGDSMIKQVQGWKLGKQVGHRVVVKSFSGATTSDMQHYLKPTLEKNPQQIILHVGTNDLRDESPTIVADKIVDLARRIETETNAEVILSELVTRVDGTPTDSVRNVNKKLKKFCNQNGWRIIHHQNITANGLNRSGLHLNERGNNILFNNFVKFLDKSSHN